MKLISLFDNNDIDDATKESYDNPDDDNDAGDYDDNDDDVVSLFLLLSEWPAVGDHSTTRDLPPPCPNYNHPRHRHYDQHCRGHHRHYRHYHHHCRRHHRHYHHYCRRHYRHHCRRHN